MLLAFLAGILLWPVRGGQGGGEAELDRASRKYLALAQALVAGQGDSRSFTEAELNAPVLPLRLALTYEWVQEEDFQP